MKLNLEDFRGIRLFVEEYSKKYDHLDVLVNNASIYQTSYKKSNSGHERSFTINHLGVFLLTNLLLPVLERTPIINRKIDTINGPRIIMVTSDVYTLSGPLRMEDIDTVNPDSFIGIKKQLIVYGRTKLCNLLFAEELNTRIKEFGSTIVVNSVQLARMTSDVKGTDPGFGSLIETVVPSIPSSEGALCTLYVCCDPGLNSKGGKCFVAPFKEIPVRDFACNQKSAKALWDFSEKAVDHTLNKWF